MSSSVDVHNREVSTAMAVLGALSFCHLLNDMMQSLLPAMYPILKTGLKLDFGQIGLVTFVYQITASLLQPLVGLYADRRPMPYALACGMGFTLTGLVLLSVASTFPVLLLAAAIDRPRLVGLSSRIFARRARGLRRTARVRAIGLPGRRQCGLGDRSVGSGIHRVAERAGERGMVRARRAARHRAAHEDRRLVRAPDSAARSLAQRRAPRARAAAAAQGRRSRSPCWSCSSSPSTSTWRA